MHWYILPIVLAWILFCLVAGRFIRLLPRNVNRLLGLFVFATFAGVLYCIGEFIGNKGPDDWGSLWHASYPLSAKYGSHRESSYSVNTFDRDPDGSGSGTYHVRFEYDGHSGVILCHYNKTTGKFDRDEIVPDK